MADAKGATPTDIDAALRYFEQSNHVEHVRASRYLRAMLAERDALRQRLKEAERLLEEECADVDIILHKLGFDPATYRTEGGRLRPGKIVNKLREPESRLATLTEAAKRLKEAWKKLREGRGYDIDQGDAAAAEIERSGG